MSLVTPKRTGYRHGRPANGRLGSLGVSVTTRGGIEAAICESISRFEQDYMGSGPTSIRAHLIGELLVVRLQGRAIAPH